MEIERLSETALLESGSHGTQAAAPRERLRTGRNQPCPCGSGRKYKKCCLERDRRRARESGAASIKRTDTVLDVEAFPAGAALPLSSPGGTPAPAEDTRPKWGRGD